MRVLRSRAGGWLVLIVLVSALAAPSARGADGAPADPGQNGKISFYFAAHADDWQLFMNPSAFEDVAGGAAKTVFVHTTAGDGGNGIGWGGRKHPYYLARENGARTAIQFMADVSANPVSNTAGHMTFSDHPVYRVSYRNTVSYFLRLPDGSPSGTGYYETGSQSLTRLAEGKIDTLTAIDGSTVYRGWSDLVATLRAILDYERGSAALIQINTAELDPSRNPGDHADHLMTAKAARDAANDLPCVRRVSYLGYASSGLAVNLDAEQRDREDSVFAVTLAGVLAFDHGTSWHHRSYVGRNYFRVEEPAGRCAATGTEIAATPATAGPRSPR